MHFRYHTLCLLIILFSSSAALSQPLWQTLNEAVVYEHIIPHHEELANSTNRLNEAAKQFCEATNAETLDNLRNAYFSVNDTWMQLQHFHHGPIHEEKRIYRIQLFPDKRDAVGKHLTKLINAANTDTLKPEKFIRLSTALQGISALEHLLFSDKYPLKSFQSKDFPNKDSQLSFQCQLVHAISVNLVNIAQQTLNEWNLDTPLYEQFFNIKKYPLNDPKIDPILKARTEVVAIIFNSYHSQIGKIINSKLIMPLGRSINASRPFWSESQYSQRSLLNIKLNLEALEQLYELTYAPYLKLKTDGDTLHKQVKQAYRDVFKSISAIGMPLTEAVDDPDGRNKIEAVIRQLEALQKITMEKMTKTLGISLKFNGINGD